MPINNKKNADIRNEDFKAKDIYKSWSIECKKAQDSICVLSNVIDQTVPRLLASKLINPEVSKKVYTRIDSLAIYDMPYHVRALINCKKKGIRVFQVDQLNANSLIIDNKYISLGSQNFTACSRRNKETSLMSNWNFESTSFLKTINLWMENAQEIELRYLISLESKLKKFRPSILKLQSEHSLVFNQVFEEEKKHRALEEIRKIEERNAAKRNRIESELSRNLGGRELTSNVSFATGNIFITKSYMDSLSTRITYKADYDKDLTKWNFRRINNDDDLIRLFYYPCINVENNSISFVRLTKTRISFFSSGIKLSNAININNKYYFITVNCPNENTFEVNYIVTIKSYSDKVCKLNFLFDGNKFNYISGTCNSDLLKREILDSLLNSEIELNSLFKKVFRGFNISSIAKPIKNFFNARIYKLSLVDYLDNPIIVAKEL